MKKYKIFVNAFDLSAGDYVIQTIVVETDDIYHEVGRIYCKSLGKIKDISYFEI